MGARNEYIEEEFERSIRLLSDGNLVDADLVFQSPKDPNVLCNLGLCYGDLGDLDIAIDTLKKHNNSNGVRVLA